MLAYDIPGGGGTYWRELAAHKRAVKAITYLPEFRNNKRIRMEPVRIPGGLSQFHPNVMPQPLLFGGRRGQPGVVDLRLSPSAERWSRRYEITYDLTAAHEPMTKRPVQVEVTEEDLSQFEHIEGHTLEGIASDDRGHLQAAARTE